MTKKTFSTLTLRRLEAIGAADARESMASCVAVESFQDINRDQRAAIVAIASLDEAWEDACRHGMGKGTLPLRQAYARGWDLVAEGRDSMARMGGKSKSFAKVKAAAENGKKGGRPNAWPGKTGGKWFRVQQVGGESILAWACYTDPSGSWSKAGTLFDDAGKPIHIPFRFKKVRSVSGPSWIVNAKPDAGNP